MFDVVEWPAILVLEGDDELGFFANRQEFLRYVEEQGDRLTDADRLVDSNGNEFCPDYRGQSPGATGRRVALEEVIELVRAHFSQAGQCCVSKYQARSIGEAILDMSQMTPT